MRLRGERSDRRAGDAAGAGARARLTARPRRGCGRWCAELGAERVVVGLPLSLSGADSAQTTETRAFAARLEQRAAGAGRALRRALHDARWRSAPAGSASEDSRAAAHLLESWLAAAREPGGGRRWLIATPAEEREAARLERERRRAEREAASTAAGPPVGATAAVQRRRPRRGAGHRGRRRAAANGETQEWQPEDWFDGDDGSGSTTSDRRARRTAREHEPSSPTVRRRRTTTTHDGRDDEDDEVPVGTRRVAHTSARSPAGRPRKHRREPAGAAASAGPAPPAADSARSTKRKHSWAGRLLGVLALVAAGVVIWFLVELFQPFQRPATRQRDRGDPAALERRADRRHARPATA